MIRKIECYENYRTKIVMIMEKKEAMKILKDFYDKSALFSIRTALDTIIPELRGNDDERIRKELIEYFKHYSGGDALSIKFPEWIAWLEKQGEKPQGKTALEAINEEKVDNQNCVKLNDKVESKFHKGDWIVSDTANKDYRICKITDVKDGIYAIESIYGYKGYYQFDVFDNTYRLWDITKDAKDGDILVSQYGRPFNYNDNRDSVLVGSYYGISADGNFRVATEKCHWTENTNIHPATKEQRDALTKAMTDAGYTFDFEKKELKKIEDEIEIPFGAKDSELQEATYYIPVGFHAEIDDDKVVVKKGEQKPTDEEMKELLRTEYEKGRADAIAETQVAWSEEDKVMLKETLALIETIEDINKAKDGFLDVKMWLKSLKDRVQPKQEWDEDDSYMLEQAIKCVNNSEKLEVSTEEIEEWLKALKERITNKQ